ncbi:MAG: hypothetical protein LBF27_07175 [Sphingobacterium sp.]|jgi:hypothetical protein|nr:hypothetical protein [Sphingobacterium sp.]
MFDKNTSIFFSKENLREPTTSDHPSGHTQQEVPDRLRLLWPVGKTIPYGVRILLGNGDQQTEIKYEAEITGIQQIDENNLFKIDRKQVYINETKPDLIVDQLAYEVGTVFYPLVVALDAEGAFVGIANQMTVRERWPKHKLAIRDYFEGELVDNYLNLFEDKLNDDSAINMAFLQDWFIASFFATIYKDYGHSYRLNSYFRFPNITSFAVDGYAVEQHLEGKYNHFGAITLSHQGIAHEEDHLSGESKAVGNYSACYTLHPRFRHMISLEAHYTYKDTQDTKIYIHLIPPEGQDIDYDFIDKGQSEPLIEKPTGRRFLQKLFDR